MLRLPLFLLVLLALALPAQADPPTDESRLLTAERTWQMQRIGNPVVSPDGRLAVAPVTRFDLDTDESTTSLWLFATDGSIERELTTNGSSPVFSPDGSELAFVARRNGDRAAQLYLLPMDEPGEARRLTEVPTGVGSPRWAGDHLYFASTVWPRAEWDAMADSLDARSNRRMSAHTWDALPTSSFDRWIDPQREVHLFRVSVNGGEIERITEPTGWAMPVQGAVYDVAPDGSMVAFQSDARRDGANPQLDLFLVRPGESEARRLTTNEAPDGSPLFSPDSRRLAFTTQRIVGFYADTRKLNVHDFASGTTREVAADWDRSADGLVWAPDGQGFFGSIDDAGTRRLYRIPLDGTPQPITADTDFPSVDVADDGTLVALNNSFLYPPRVVVVSADGSTRRLDTINDDVMEGVEMGTVESVTYTGADGADIQMWVHYPPGFDRSRQYPLLFLIHGGPHNAITDGFHFRWNAQTFASWGYVVTWHNFHGSSGFGQDFADAINPDWINRPYEDTIAGAAFMAERPYIDADRMVAAGASYGGYLSTVLLGRDHPFNALVIHAPVYNFFSQMAGDFAVHSARFGGYWEHDLYEQFSPHVFADRFETPSLLIHGQLDYRVPVGQSFELFRTLQERGVDSRLIYFPDENHWILKPNNSLYWYSQVREWVERYAEPGPR